jgi:hypothetical protein
MRFNHTYKFIWIALVFLALITQTFKLNLFIADYYVNAANYLKSCINKSKPKSSCQGKCQMMKKMREEQQKDEKTSNTNSEKKGEQVVYCNHDISNYSFFPITENLAYVMVNNGAILYFHSKQWRPPIAA